jgi:hypothetical protein
VLRAHALLTCPEQINRYLHLERVWVLGKQQGVHVRLASGVQYAIPGRIRDALATLMGHRAAVPLAKTGVGGIDTIIRMANEPWRSTANSSR